MFAKAVKAVDHNSGKPRTDLNKLTAEELQPKGRELRDREAAQVKVLKLDAKLDDARQKLIIQQKLISELEGKREEAILRAEAERKRRADDFDAASSRSRKKFKYAENPFLAEKSSYNRRRFEVNNPFISVFEVKSLRAMPADKVCDGQRMKEDALSRAVDLLLKPVAETRRRYKHPHGELSGRIVHASALYGIKWLTLPAGSTREQEQVVDSVLTAGGTEVVFNPEGTSLHETDELLHEGDPVNWDEFVTVEKYDLKGQHRDLTIDGDDNLVTVLLVECDWEGSLNKLYQGSSYGVTAALDNLQKGCSRPIYIENWSESSWRYGVLRPQAIVTVKEGHVVNVMGPKTDDLSLSQLQQRLDGCTTKLQDEYMSPCEYPDKDYVLGTLHICNGEKMALPNSFEDRYLTVHSLRFLQSLVRIFVGDARALTLTVEDIECNFAAREAEIKEDMDRIKLTIHAAYKGKAYFGLFLEIFNLQNLHVELGTKGTSKGVEESGVQAAGSGATSKGVSLVGESGVQAAGSEATSRGISLAKESGVQAGSSGARVTEDTIYEENKD